MELFSTEKVTEITSISIKSCRFCGENRQLIKTMIDSRTGNVIHLFRCSTCGEQNWED